MFVEGKSRTVFFPSDTLIYGISRDGSKNYNIRTCEHMILGQLRMGARQTNYASLLLSKPKGTKMYRKTLQLAGTAAHTKQENFGADPFSPGILNILDLYEKSPRGYFVRPAAYKVHYF